MSDLVLSCSGAAIEAKERHLGGCWEGAGFVFRSFVFQERVRGAGCCSPAFLILGRCSRAPWASVSGGWKRKEERGAAQPGAANMVVGGGFG